MLPSSAPVMEAVLYPEPLDYSRQAVVLPDTQKQGQTGHYRHALWGMLDPHSPATVNTLPQVFEYGLAKSADKPFTGHRPIVSLNPLTYSKEYVWETYGQVDEHRRNIGSALEYLFSTGAIGGSQLPTVGIWCQNRPEWQHIDLALHAYGKVGVALYDTLGPDAVEYIIGHAELTIIFAASQHMPTLLALAAKMPVIKFLVSIDELTHQVKQLLHAWGNERNVKIMDLLEIKALGKAHRREPIPVTPDQIASICYTSGTTGNPKGALLSHGCLAVSTHALVHGANFKDVGILLSYLPLAHIYERVCELLVIVLGGQIGYFTGDPLRLLEDAQILRPTYFPSVPRVLNRIYQGAMNAANVPGLRGNIFRKACEVKMKKLKETGDNTHAFWDKLVFRKIQAVLGGRLETMTCGSAPITSVVMDFLKIAFACDVLEGYGMTENCGTCTRVWSRDPGCSGSVGAPQPNVEMKLIDVPSMGYHADDKPNPRGEICARGPGCFSGYYKDEKNTVEAVDVDGWLHTGDVGEVDSCGRFKIIDRVKNIMKLAQGEYVALEKIENLYSACFVVQQIYVHGDSLQDYLIGVVVPDPIGFAKLISNLYGKNVSPDDSVTLERAMQDPKMSEAVLSELMVEARKVGLKGFETVKRIHLSAEPFSVENNLLTPTLKIKRKDAYKKYKQELDQLYALGPVTNGRL